MSNEHYKIPWYKNYMVWVILVLPLLSVTGSFAMLAAAITHNDSPVLEGYYKDGLSPKKLEATALSEHINASIANGVLTIKADAGFAPRTVLLKLEHPTLASKDRYLTLTAAAPNTFPLDEETQRQLRLQHWYLRLYDQGKTWELKGETPVTVNGELPAFSLSAQ